jgi:hypothetical protein
VLLLKCKTASHGATTDLYPTETSTYLQKNATIHVMTMSRLQNNVACAEKLSLWKTQEQLSKSPDQKKE